MVSPKSQPITRFLSRAARSGITATLSILEQFAKLWLIDTEGHPNPEWSNCRWLPLFLQVLNILLLFSTSLYLFRWRCFHRFVQ